MESVAKMKRLVPDQFHCLVKMHLSFLLDLTFDDCDCSFLYDSEVLTTPTKKKSFFTPKKKLIGTNGVMDGAPLTQVSWTLSWRQQVICIWFWISWFGSRYHHLIWLIFQEGVCQVFQIIEYLKRGNNIKCEGLFRKVITDNRNLGYNHKPL